MTVLERSRYGFMAMYRSAEVSEGVAGGVSLQYNTCPSM